MGITNANKELSRSSILCGEEVQVRLSLTAAPDITSNPTDIVLILDRSQSMAGTPLINLKNGANAFVDIIAEATGGLSGGEIGYGSRIAVVSFADTATADTQLITSVADLKTAVDNLSAGGNTNHAAAFEKASELLAAPSTNAKVMVMFTDGETTAGPDPSPVAAAARDGGAIIYAIGLNGSGGLNVAALEDWASKPASAYVAITPDDTQLEELFKDLARNITKPGATKVVVTDKISSCFQIISVSLPTKGTATLLDPNTVQWGIDELGVSQSEGAVLEFTVKHIGPCSGIIQANESVSYQDAQGNVVTFPSPEVDVDCDIVVFPEPCPKPVDLTVNGCEDTVEFDAGDLAMDSLGRIVRLSVILRSVCPKRRVALAAVLTEVDDEGQEYGRGMKTMLIPAHTRDGCRDVEVRCLNFVLPESLDISGSANAICSTRRFKARFLANYVDTDFTCCDLLL